MSHTEATTTELPTTIPAVVHRAAALWPGDEAVVDRDVRLTFAELDAAVREAARAFVATGLQPGDRATVWAPNLHQWIVAALGLYAAGGVLVPLNTRFKGTEAAHVLRTSGARFLFTVSDFLDTNYVELLDGAGARDLVEEIVILEGSVPDGTVSWADFLARGADGDTGTIDAEVDRREAAISGDTMSDIIGQREAVARQADGRLQRVFQRLPAVRAHKLGPARQVARRADREGAVAEVVAPGEALHRQPRGNRRHEIEHAHAPLGRHVAGRIAESGEAGHEGLNDVERGRRRRRGVEGIAAVCQQPGTGLRGKRMRGRHDAVQR